ncbi:homeobox protein homothorax isoform X4 [Vespula maculifrons]|uniref:Homeobox protein homothorax isoform X4 n=1 Tax=Vespula maculifrons TaxID=7453 RepID=A0ABD2D3Q0_VESMC
MEDEPNCEITGLPPQPSSRRCEPHTSLPYGERGRRLRVKARKWCPRREWSSPPDAQRAASDAARRGVLYSSVFLGSPDLTKKTTTTTTTTTIIFERHLSLEKMREEKTKKEEAIELKFVDIFVNYIITLSNFEIVCYSSRYSRHWNDLGRGSQTLVVVKPAETLLALVGDTFLNDNSRILRKKTS